MYVIKIKVPTNRAGSETRGRWQRKAQLLESKTAVNDAKFSPRHFGLQVAAASSDGKVYIYEARNQFALHQWQLKVAIYSID